jgi:hypothetical protein
MKSVRLLEIAAVVLITALTSACAWAGPKHIYLTYSGAPETSIDINIILHEREGDVDVYFDTKSHGGKVENYAHHVTVPFVPTLMEISDRRALYVAALTGLEPGTDYYFVAGEEEYGMSSERKFRTLPGGDNPIRFVNGGDMGVDGLVIPLLKLAGEQDPDFALVGGDLAYVNGLLAGNETWDKWLENWDKLMVTNDGRMIPIVTAIGNHETNRYETTDKNLKAPWYTSLFGRQGSDIFYTRRFGDNLVIFFLDSGHLVTHEEQAPWLEQEMAKHQDVKYKFAAYHVPLYPAHREYEGMGSQMGRQHWLPIFDRYGLTVGLEHHDHVFKRTKVLKANQVADSGTVYIGDGCFGRGPRTIDEKPRWYNEKETAVAHFWVVDVEPKGLAFKAIDDKGKTVDQFELPG